MAGVQPTQGDDVPSPAWKGWTETSYLPFLDVIDGGSGISTGVRSLYAS